MFAVPIASLITSVPGPLTGFSLLRETKRAAVGAANRSRTRGRVSRRLFRGRPAPPARLAGRPRTVRRTVGRHLEPAQGSSQCQLAVCNRPTGRRPSPMNVSAIDTEMSERICTSVQIWHMWWRHPVRMALSHYKGPWIGKLPMCAICGGAGQGTRAEHFLTHGVSVWLCEPHRSEEFQRRRSGRDFVVSVGAVWRAAGITGWRHSQALGAHLRRVRGAPQRERPGSYAWPELRQEAERRFASGEPPRRVIAELRQAPLVGMRLPSIRTLRRWFHEGRWLERLVPRPSGSKRRAKSSGQSKHTPQRDAPRDRPCQSGSDSASDVQRAPP